MFKRILVANRGEIALRIIRACKEMGIETVAIYSEGDRGAAYLDLADQALCVGGPRSHESYLKINQIIAAAEVSGSEAVHPGFGFLSENAHFNEVCRDCNIEFIGPSPKAMLALGDKNTARSLAMQAQVPVVPGSEGLIEDENQATQVADSIGYPVLIKATAGGGGKGMRVAESRAALKTALQQAKTEAQAAFGNGGVYLEKYVLNPRHVEVQIIADHHGNVVHLWERDCSVQRRHQKLIEQSPAPNLSQATRVAICEAAVRMIRAADYTNAGTVEFIVDPEENFYFIEVNARIQVEHPVTEMVTGIDLIAEQLHIAGGEPLRLRQSDVQLRGHAIECRINAEDPQKNFRPAPGRITGWLPPGGPGVRVDSHVYTGYEIPVFYDSLIGKLIVWAPDREGAIRRMRRALMECAITGISTTIDFHLSLLDRPEFQRGDIHTKFVEQEMLPG